MKRFPKILHIISAICLVAAPLGAQGLPKGPPPPAPLAAPEGQENIGWPRYITSRDAEITIFQPQLDSWDNDQLAGRAVVSVTTKASPQPLFGVVWFSARTDVDKESGQVSLEDVQITQGDFPKEPGDPHDYVQLIRQNLPQAASTIALERLESGLAITQAEQRVEKLP